MNPRHGVGMRVRPWLRALVTVGIACCLLASGCSLGTTKLTFTAVPPLAAAAPVAGQAQMYPLPGSVTASPDSQVSIRGVEAARIEPIAVTGSQTGVHNGSVLVHPDGRGASFLPAEPFAAGEVVSVRAGVTLTGSGTPDATFTVATPASVRPRTIGSPVVDVAADTVRHFVSSPLQPPVVRVRTNNTPAGEGDLMLTPHATPSGAGPLITAPNGSVLWFQPLAKGERPTNLQVTTYRGQTVLAYWHGSVVLPGYGMGSVTLLDTHYQPVAEFGAGNGFAADSHELQITPGGTAYLAAYNPIRWDASSIGGSRHATVYDCVVQEVDIATGAVLFEWHALDHVALDKSYLPAPSGSNDAYDYFHVNSIGVGPAGDLLVSSRHTSALFDIDAASGQVRWQLGGKGSDFVVPPPARFAYQHDARWLANGDITLLDNASREKTPTSTEHSSALEVAVDVTAHTVRVVHRFTAPEKPLGDSQGNQQRLPDGSFFVGWGSAPELTEFDPQGHVLYDAELATAVSYRTFRQPWTGEPLTQPSWVVRHEASGTAVYVSWNGDTRSASWELLSGPRPDSLQVVDATKRAGFETRLDATPLDSYVAVRALDAQGNVLATSDARASG